MKITRVGKLEEKGKMGLAQDKIYEMPSTNKTNKYGVILDIGF